MKVQLADDTALWSAALSGDGAAFAQLWDRHRDSVFRQALRHVGNRFDAEDTTAIAFLEAWRLRKRVRVVDGSVLPWLLTTCANVARNGERSRRRYRKFLQDLPPAPATDPLDVLHTRDRAAQALEALAPVDRELLTLTAVDGMNLREAGERLGLSHDAARARLSRAKARLRAVARSVDEEGAAS